jgi:hypothetical protein
MKDAVLGGLGQRQFLVMAITTAANTKETGKAGRE